jgi:hypothetical protein
VVRLSSSPTTSTWFFHPTRTTYLRAWEACEGAALELHLNDEPLNRPPD